MKIIKLILWLITVIPATILFFLIGWDAYEMLYSKYGILPMRLPK